MGELVIIAGPPGAGKSSVSEHLVNEFTPSALVAGDSFFAMIKNGYLLPWLPEARRQNTVIIKAAAAAAGRLTDICSVIYDGVLGPWFLPTFVRATGLPHINYVSCCLRSWYAWSASGVALVMVSVIFQPLEICTRSLPTPLSIRGTWSPSPAIIRLSLPS